MKIIRNCGTCKYALINPSNSPCTLCIKNPITCFRGLSYKWEPKKKKINMDKKSVTPIPAEPKYKYIASSNSGAMATSSDTFYSAVEARVAGEDYMSKMKYSSCIVVQIIGKITEVPRYQYEDVK